MRKIIAPLNEDNTIDIENCILVEEDGIAWAESALGGTWVEIPSADLVDDGEPRHHNCGQAKKLAYVPDAVGQKVADLWDADAEYRKGFPVAHNGIMYKARATVNEAGGGRGNPPPNASGFWERQS